MQYIPFSMIKAIHEQTHSAEPHAPVRPYRPRRHLFRALLNQFRSKDVCEAEVRDRGTTPASVARAC